MMNFWTPLTVLGFVAIAGAAIAYDHRQDPTKKAIASIEYVNDQETGLCYAVRGDEIMNVPCVIDSHRIPVGSSKTIAATYVSEMKFAREPRTGLCYGMHNGSLKTTVPCEAVASLLVG